MESLISAIGDFFSAIASSLMGKKKKQTKGKKVVDIPEKKY